MNSLDVVPNSVAQAAAAIEEKRTHNSFPRAPSPLRLGRRPSVQDRAFAAPRMQSLERMRAHADDPHELANMLDCLPRRHALRCVHGSSDYHTLPSNRKGRVLLGEDAAELKRRLRHVRSNETNCSGATLRRGNSVRSQRAGAGYALGFREAEVREDMELGGLAPGGESSFEARLEKRGRDSIWLGGRRVWRGRRGLGR